MYVANAIPEWFGVSRQDAGLTRDGYFQGAGGMGFYGREAVKEIVFFGVKLCF